MLLHPFHGMVLTINTAGAYTSPPDFMGGEGGGRVQGLAGGGGGGG